MKPEQIITELKRHLNTHIQSWGSYPGYSTDDDKINRCYNSACMSNVSQARGCTSLWVHNLKPKEITDPSNDSVIWAYTCWISDPDESPWKSLLPKEKSLILAGEDVYSTDFRNKWGYYFPDVKDFPSKLTTNFCKAVRNPRERYDTMKQWYDLVVKGVHPALAYVMCPCITGPATQKTVVPSGIWGHGCVNVWHLGEKDVVLFANGQPSAETTKFSQAPQYIGNDSIWEQSNSTPKYHYIFHDSLKRKSQNVVQKVVSGMFNKVSLNISVNAYSQINVPIDFLVEHFKSEEKRLGLTPSKLLERIESERTYSQAA